MPTLIVIAGPTAIGKSALAIQLAQHFNTEILSADSRQFYKGMNIGTAKPSQEELALVHHHFIDTLELSDDYNISQYEVDALRVLETLFKKKEVAILTGGSGLYIRAACEGIDDIPGRNEEIRNTLLDLLNTGGIEVLKNKLKELDPEYYNSVDLSNPHRLIRALEVCMTSGKKYSSLRIRQIQDRPFKIIKIGLLLDRLELYKRIERRVDDMMKQGLSEEVRNLLPYRHLNSLNTVGYKELFEYFDEQISLGDAVNLIKKHTRNYAKRQMTWFRNEAGIKWFEPTDAKGIIEYIKSELKS